MLLQTSSSLFFWVTYFSFFSHLSSGIYLLNSLLAFFPLYNTLRSLHFIFSKKCYLFKQFILLFLLFHTFSKAYTPRIAYLPFYLLSFLILISYSRFIFFKYLIKSLFFSSFLPFSKFLRGLYPKTAYFSSFS